MDGFIMKTSMPPHSYNRACHSHNLFISSFFLQVVYDRGEIYSFSKYGRFCQEIKLNYSPYKNYFTRVFWNRSYHVYKVNSVISFQYWLSFRLSWWCMLILYLVLCINVIENTWIPGIWKLLLSLALPFSSISSSYLQKNIKDCFMFLQCVQRETFSHG